MSDSGAPPKLSDKQQRVLQAALDVFAERGFHGASTSEIAKRAGVAEGTLFKQYKTKKELMIGVLAPVFAHVIAPVVLNEVREILQAPHATVEDFLLTIFRNRLAFLTKHERVARIALQEVPFHGEVRELVKSTMAAQVLPDAIALVERFQREGKVRAAEPTSVLRVIAGTFFTFVFTRMMVAPEAAWDDDAEVTLMAQVLAQGLKPPDRA